MEAEPGVRVTRVTSAKWCHCHRQWLGVQGWEADGAGVSLTKCWAIGSHYVGRTAFVIVFYIYSICLGVEPTCVYVCVYV